MMTDDPIHRSLIGYFDQADAPATYDPGISVPCPICGLPWTPDTVKTISVRARNGLRSYFFRLHRACQQARPGAVTDIEHWIVDSLP